MNSEYDYSWDEGNSEGAWDRKYAEWRKRDWLSWLNSNLDFPFTVNREEDEDSFSPYYEEEEPFSIGHTMNVLGIEDEDDHVGIVVKVKEGKKTGYVPLCDLEVKPKEDKNFWPVREYVVWFANREV